MTRCEECGERHVYSSFCDECGLCAECCDCSGDFDADELGLDPEGDLEDI